MFVKVFATIVRNDTEDANKDELLLLSANVPLYWKESQKS